MISIILIQPENSGNIGAVARAMKNFGVNNLVIIHPKVKVNTITSRKRSKHAVDIIKKAKVKDINFLKKFDCLIATTAKLGTDYNIPRSPISPEQLTKITNKRSNIGLVFGRESKGLTNKEIALCDFLVSIPTSKDYPSMNLSHAVTILLYELFKNKENIASHITPASKIEKQQLMKNINQILNKLKFTTDSKKQTQKTIWKRILGKSFLTKREAFALIGFFKKLK